MSAIISQVDSEALARPHVARLWLAKLDLPTGIAFLHSGTGRVTIDGQVWRGVSDPVGGRLVSVGQVDEPQFGQAASVTLVLAGADKAFIQSVHATASQVEGRAATVYWAAFDGETQQLVTALIPVFPFGRMTSPTIKWQGIGVREVSLTVESIWQAKNFPPGGRWNPADQHRRFPNDKGLDFVGVEITDYWQ